MRPLCFRMLSGPFPRSSNYVIGVGRKGTWGEGAGPPPNNFGGGQHTLCTPTPNIQNLPTPMYVSFHRGILVKFSLGGCTYSGEATQVGCFGFNVPLRQYCSLYRTASREEEKKVRSNR